MPTAMPGAGSVVERETRRSGARIRYLDNAPAEPLGVPLLFSPGFTDFADEYITMLEFFAPRRVLVVEVRGRGGSEAPPTGYGAGEHAADLRAVLDEEDVDRFHLMTFSRGTTWGLELMLTEPERVATVSIGDYPAGEIELPVAAADHVLTTRFRGRTMAERVERHVVVELFRQSRGRDLYRELGATGRPVLVATGTGTDCMAGPAVLEAYHEHVPGVEMVTIPDAGHDLFRRDRLAYPRAVAAFIERHAPER